MFNSFFCNGFQALIKLGLVPFGKIVDTDEHCPTLTFNSIGRHQSRIVTTRVASANSPWLSGTQVGELYNVPISHGEGRFLANRGYYYIPHVVQKIQDEDLDSTYTQRHYTMVERKYYETVVEGMRKSVLGGTCRAANNPWYEVCGKTGTAQNPHGQDHSVFMGFAPRENPQIAICVYVENGGWGATYGVPIGALMMEQYINGHLSPESEQKAVSYENKHLFNLADYVNTNN